MAAYYRKFIPKFSEITAELYRLLKRNVDFDWSEAFERNFNLIKEGLRNPALLVHPDFSKPFVLVTDASKFAIGHVMMQEFEGVLRSVLYGGRVLTEAESRYCVTDKELLGVYNAVRKCEFYLIGHKLVVYTDHKPLVYLKSFKTLVDKRFRWINYLETVNTNIRYIPGKQNVVSDFISRNIIKEEDKLNVLVNFAEMNLFSYDFEELKNAQRNDRGICYLIKHFQGVTGEIPRKFRKHVNKLFIDEH